ncbi:DUF1059 domain-containing protein [Actinomycetospora sp.]|jgi:hypothetical protein|uniref:DUF1059 domain-containing protein n=1 Tax=Actinomycetospora sp. TaxID=1872135 RepID=UPI002F406723
MTRKIADCREMPSESGCTLTLTGEEDEVLEAATAHAVAVHGHTDDPALRDGIRGMLRDAPEVTGPGAFVQLIEFRTTRIDQFDGLLEQWLAEIGPDRTARWLLLAADRDRPGEYLQLVEFPSYEAAMTNSAHPATAASAERMGKLAEGEPGFRNLDIIAARTP